MSRMIAITIDGKPIEVEERSTILQAAARVGVWIPSLCHHEAVSDLGACRTCIVEIERKGRRRIVTACNYPIEESIAIETANEKVSAERRLIVELLLARSPNSPVIKELATRLGVKGGRFENEDERCILCGLCVRVCDEVMGRRAIDFVGRGVDERGDTPFGVQSDDCIGCGACASVCPAGIIFVDDSSGARRIVRWHAEFDLEPCPECGKPVSTRRHIEYLREKMNITDCGQVLCEECKRRLHMEKAAVEGHM